MFPILFTPGEPAGIGPDLCVQLAATPLPYRVVIVADPALIAARASQLGEQIQIRIYQPASPWSLKAGTLEILPISCLSSVEAGKLNPGNARYILDTLDAATGLCLQGKALALVTGPVHKGNINDAGIPFSGHTEYLAHQTGGHPVMMLATPGLRVALASTHLPLRSVSEAITQESLERVLFTLWNDLTHRLRIPTPRILVCGLNPHAGEGGHLGHEEIDVIIPVLSRMRSQGFDLRGPLPADTAFTPPHLSQVDVVLTMYHDQGLPVLKHMGFGKSVNITLGLPIIRTSVDHGTALELAGTGAASPSSLRYAIEVAAEMAGLSPLTQERELTT